MRNVEHWSRTVDRDVVLRVYKFTGNINTANQFLAPFYIIRNGKLGVRTTLSGEPTKAMLDADSLVRYGLTQQQFSFDDYELTLEKGDVLVFDAETDLLYSVICSTTPYREVLFGLGYNYAGEESRDGKARVVSFSKTACAKRDVEEQFYQAWWVAHGNEYTQGTYSLEVERGSVYMASIFTKDLPDIQRRTYFLKTKSVFAKSEDQGRSVKFDPTAAGTLSAVYEEIQAGELARAGTALFGDKQKADADRNVFILQEINKAADGNVFDAWGCYQKLNHYHDVSKEEFAAKVKFLEFGLWKRFKFWLARN